MADLQDPLIQLTLTSFAQSFITGAEGEMLHKPNRPVCFLPTSLSCEAGEWVWATNAYATVYDIPISGKLLDAARVVVHDNLEAEIVLPPNMKIILDDQFLWPEWHMTFVQQFIKFNAIYARWVEAEYGELEDPDEFSIVIKALENWRQTCDALIVCPNFSSTWDVPAFFEVYDTYCTRACLDYFHHQKELFPYKEEFWEVYLKEALAVIGEWRHMYDVVLSPKFVASPKCLWYHRYFFQNVKEDPGSWHGFFDGTIFNERGAIAMPRLTNGFSGSVRYHFTVDSPLTVDMEIHWKLENQDTTCDDQTLSSGFVTQT